MPITPEHTKKLLKIYYTSQSLLNDNEFLKTIDNVQFVYMIQAYTCIGKQLENDIASDFKKTGLETANNLGSLTPPFAK